MLREKPSDQREKRNGERRTDPEKYVHARDGRCPKLYESECDTDGNEDVDHADDLYREEVVGVSGDLLLHGSAANVDGRGISVYRSGPSPSRSTASGEPRLAGP